MSEGLHILVVDHDPWALAQLRDQLERSPLAGRVDAVTSVREALVHIAAERYDCLFFDVAMPYLGGPALTGALRRLVEPPAIILLGDRPDAAAEALGVQPVDVLVRPIAPGQVDEALERAAGVRMRAGAPAGRTGGGGVATAPERGVVVVDAPRGAGKRTVPLEAVTVVQAHGDYVRIFSDEGRFLLRMPLTSVEAQWAAAGFTRVHRSYVVNLRRVVELRGALNGTGVLEIDDGSQVPVARRMVSGLRRRLAAAS